MSPVEVSGPQKKAHVLNPSVFFSRESCGRLCCAMQPSMMWHLVPSSFDLKGLTNGFVPLEVDMSGESWWFPTLDT